MELSIKKKKATFELYLDGEFFQICDRILFQKKFSEKIFFQDKKQADHWFYQLEKNTLLEFCFYLLGKKSYHSAILKKKLILRNFSKRTIEKIISFLIEKKVVNDNQWLQYQIEKAQKKEDGPKKIFYQLYLQGINKEEIQKALDIYYPDEIEKKIIEKCKQKYFMKDEKKLQSFLKRKGFNFVNFFD